jgi:osmoprotectant transport system ATP-binding protein
VIEFQNITKRFPDGTYAVEDFSLVVPSRQVTVFVGSSGAGKTTLLRMINRMVNPTSGKVLIDGEDVAGLNPVLLRRKIGYVLQATGLLPHRKISDNIASVPRLNGVSKKQAFEDALTLMDTVGLDRSLADKYPDQLSGGQLMDEPFGAVDPIVRLELQEEINRLQRELHKTTVFVTHNIEEAFAIADQVVILREGGVIAQAGTPAEILANPADDFVSSFIGADKGKRTLHLQKGEDGVTLLVDDDGRPAGILGDKK